MIARIERENAFQLEACKKENQPDNLAVPERQHTVGSRKERGMARGSFHEWWFSFPNGHDSTISREFGKRLFVLSFPDAKISSGDEK